LPSVAEIEKEILIKTEPSTQRLIQTLESLYSKLLVRFCGGGLENLTQEQKLNGPPMHDTFERIVKELASRGGDQVREAFEKVLVEEKLETYDKNIVRASFLKRFGEDTAFDLPAMDRSHTRELFLRFDPKKGSTVTVQKGDTFIKIARRVYPEMSQWDAIDILEFINDQYRSDSLRVNQVLKVYEYEVVRNAPAS